jgi:hypothetical protein
MVYKLVYKRVHAASYLPPLDTRVKNYFDYFEILSILFYFCRSNSIQSMQTRSLPQTESGTMTSHIIAFLALLLFLTLFI